VSISGDSGAAHGEGDTNGAASRIPTFDRLFRPVLEAVADGEARSLIDVTDLVCDLVGLDDESRGVRLPSGRTVIENRVRWATTNLVKAGLVEQPRVSTVVITEAGCVALRTVDGAITRELLRTTRSEYANWIADMGGDLPEEPRDDGAPTVWMVRAGRGGAYAPIFVERAAVIVGWGATGDVSGLSRETLVDVVAKCWPDTGRSQRGQAVNTLYRFAHTMKNDDLVVTPEPASRTILLGRVDGPYAFLTEPVGVEYQHVRGVRWFARVERDQLSYGARNSLGSLMTLTRPSHEAELLRLASAHAGDPPPEPVTQRRGRQTIREPVAHRVPIPANAAVARGTTLPEFQTTPRRLVQLLDELHNGQLALPDFQRSFVWAPDATRELLVSMIRSFPAGALLFLQGGGSTFKARAAEEAPALQVQPSHLVLDGQQRLTSLYQAIFGVGQSRFYLDIGALISGSDVNDAVRVFSVDRAAPFETLRAQADALMMPLAAVRDAGASRWRDEVVDLRGDEDPSLVRALLRDIERAHIDPLVHYAFPVTVLPQTTELEAVCTIFETLNRTGKPLTPFELISARAFAGGHSLNDYWASAVERHPSLADFALEPYYLLQVIALRLGVSCKRGSVLSLAPEDIATKWDDAVADMAAALSLLREECGVLISKWLPYRPMLIPLAAAWRDVANTAGPEHGAMRAKLKRWFWCACFTGEYESSSASLAERDTPVLKAWLAGGTEPPVVADFKWDPVRWRAVTARQQGLYRGTIALTLTQRPRDFHTAAPLSQELIEAGKIDDHHIFPRGFLKDVGRAAEVDSVLNHCLIDRATNARVGKKAPSVYLAEIRTAIGSDLDRVLASHQLPTGEHSPLHSDDFEGFLAWRLDRFTDALTEETGGIGAVGAETDPYRARLDARIETVERGLRHMIVERLENDASLLPPHVAQKIAERILAATRKHPGAASPLHETLAGQLEYFDLREIQDAITGRSLWSRFEPIFNVKETLNSRFAQLAELRNAIRHSRTLSEVTLKDGEAALAWFSPVLQDREDRVEPPIPEPFAAPQAAIHRRT
jgi:hypothetical protein